MSDTWSLALGLLCLAAGGLLAVFFFRRLSGKAEREDAPVRRMDAKTCLSLGVLLVLVGLLVLTLLIGGVYGKEGRTYRTEDWYLDNAAGETAKYLRERGYLIDGVTAGRTGSHDRYTVLYLTIRLPAGTSPQRIHEILRAANGSEFEMDAYKAGVLLMDTATVTGASGTYDAVGDTLFKDHIRVWPTAVPSPTPRPSSRATKKPAAKRTPYAADPYGAADYADPESFYDDFYDDFESFDDAELYWEEFG